MIPTNHEMSKKWPLKAKTHNQYTNWTVIRQRILVLNDNEKNWIEMKKMMKNRQTEKKFKQQVVRPTFGGKGLKSQKEPRFVTHKNILGVFIDDDNDLSPAPDVPLMLLTTAEGDNLESEEAINNGSSGINEQNTSNEYEEDQQYNKPIFIHGTLVACWMDNRMVFCVSTVHRIGQTIKRCIRKPRVTPKNKAHVDKVWGDKGKMHIEIPRLIDDYNHHTT